MYLSTCGYIIHIYIHTIYIQSTHGSVGYKGLPSAALIVLSILHMPKTDLGIPRIVCTTMYLPVHICTGKYMVILEMTD